MKIFNIEIITKKPKKIYGLLSHEGRITIGNFSETFVMPLQDWSAEIYEKQWKDSLARLKDKDSSCLIVTVQNLKTNPLVEMWPVYKQRHMIFFQNHILNKFILKELNSSLNISEFNEKNCYEFVSYPRETHTEQGNKISEWSISADDFFASAKNIITRLNTDKVEKKHTRLNE